MADDQAIQPGAVIGRDVARVDGRLKVSGQARYPSDEAPAHAAYAYLVTSSIARGRVRALHLDEARAVAGVLDILSRDNVGAQAKPPPPLGGGEPMTTLQSDRVWHDGQILAVIVAGTYEAAREAAYRVRIDYDAEPPSASFDSPGAISRALKDVDASHQDPAVGDADAAFERAELRIDARYATPAQHHNPIELFSTSCAWTDDRLTIWEPSQFVHGLRAAMAQQLDMDADKIRVISHYIGGAFGSKGFATARTAWIALAARRLNRPVKLVATRDQGYTIATYRAETRHRIRLGATRDGHLQALIHEGWELTSRPSQYKVGGTETTTRLYACPNVGSRVHIVHADRNTPGFMRAPPEWPYMFALESAMDELAVALGLDPIELRRRNDTQYEPIAQRPYTSRNLMRCYDEGARAFGWQRRDPRPRSMRDGDWLIGWGCATACYPSKIGAASARVTLFSDGHVKVQTGAQDIGTGAYTAIALTAADRLGLQPEQVRVEAGDSELPAAGLAAGSSHTASVCNAVAKACEQIRLQLARAAAAAENSPLYGRHPDRFEFIEGMLSAGNGAREPITEVIGHVAAGAIEAYAENLPPGAPADGGRKLAQGMPVISGGSSLPDRIQYAFGAEFVELRIHARTGEIRAPRILGAFASGRIVSRRTAHSQLMGGLIWGLGGALHEISEIDPRHARYVNDNLSEYLIPVNADVADVQVLVLPEEDSRVNPLGIKGIGEVGNVGTNAAVANAVFHATGKRVRELPIRVESLL
jgi:xanthine dehydrogenase YagR molybdenum-binding subunit